MTIRGIRSVTAPPFPRLAAPAWLLAAAAALAAGGCAQTPVAEAPAPLPAAVAPAPAVSRTVTEAVARHRRLADAARKAGDLATAEVQLEILNTLAPTDTGIARELAGVRGAIGQEVRAQYQAGNAALAAGDLDRAQAAMLRVLAVDPSQAGAAKALREIDRRRLTRIQADRAAKVRIAEEAPARTAARSAPAVAAGGNDGGGDAFDVDQALEMLRAGDATGGLRDLRAYVEAHPGNKAARQRIGAAVAERARELEDQGAREQALNLYEQASALRGDAQGPWVVRIAPLRKKISQDYYDRGIRAYRTNLAQAIGFFEASVRHDPSNTQAAIKLREAKDARAKLDRIK